MTDQSVDKAQAEPNVVDRYELGTFALRGDMGTALANLSITAHWLARRVRPDTGALDDDLSAGRLELALDDDLFDAIVGPERDELTRLGMRTLPPMDAPFAVGGVTLVRRLRPTQPRIDRK